MKFLKVISFSALSLIISCSKSTEPGESGSWFLQSSQQDDNTYHSIFFINNNVGWITGYTGAIKITTDGGYTWKPQQSGVTSDIHDIYFVSTTDGWACGKDNTILKTANGGSSWQNISPTDPKSKYYLSIKFVNDEVGWTINNHGELFKSIDGGITWQLKKKFREMGALFSVIDENTIYVFQGKLYRTFDNGATWDSVNTVIPLNYSERDMYFSNKNSGIISTFYVGGAIVKDAFVLITNDGGLNWSVSSMPDGGVFSCCYLINENMGWTADINEIYKTTDGGRNWIMEFSSPDDYLHARDLCFINEYSGWLLTWNGDIYKYKNY